MGRHKKNSDSPVRGEASERIAPLGDTSEKIASAEAVSAEEAPKEETPTRALTPEEVAIAARSMDVSDDWRTITEADVEEFSLAEDPLKLPPAAQKEQDERRFAFRWIERKAGRVDQIRSQSVPKKWWICNAINTPFLKGEFDPILGCVCRLDQMLVFKPWWMHRKYQDLKMEIAEGLDHSGDIAKKNGQETLGGASKWQSGPEHKISSKDEVMDPAGALAAEEAEESYATGSEDLVVDE